MANDINNTDETIAKLEKADGIGNIVEGILDIIVGLGVGYTGPKIALKLYQPKNLPEKILMGIGIAGTEYAILDGAFNYIHKCCHPFEEQKKQTLMNQTMVMMNVSNDLSVEAIKNSKAAMAASEYAINTCKRTDDDIHGIYEQSMKMMKTSNELSSEAVRTAQAAREEAELLCKAIYESVEVPDVGVDINKFIEDVNVNIDSDEEEGNDNE